MNDVVKLLHVHIIHSVQRCFANISQLIGIQSDYTIIDPGDCADIISIIETEHGMDKVKDFPRSSQLVSAHSKALNTNQSLEDTFV